MITNYIGTYTVDIVKDLAETYMRNQLISSLAGPVLGSLAMIVIIYGTYAIAKMLCNK